MNLNVTILGQTISFFLFVWFCMKYVWYPLIYIIEKRQKEIADNLAAAEYAKIESDRVNAEALDYLVQAKIKAQEIINHANICRMQILDEAQYEANTERHKILSQAQEQVIYERNRASEELRKEMSRFVIEATEKVIEYSINEKIDSNLIDKVITRLLDED